MGVRLFAVTYLGTLLVIGAFCADNDFRRCEVVVGHHIGFCVRLFATVFGAIFAAQLLQEWTFLLGFFPLSSGLRGLFSQPSETRINESAVLPNALGRIGIITVAGGGLSGENIALFVPFFVDLSASELLLILIVYLIGAGVVLLAAYVIVSRIAIDGIPD